MDNEWNPANDVYYRTYRGDDGMPVIVCMQWFDEFDYDQSRFYDDWMYELESDAELMLLQSEYSVTYPTSPKGRYQRRNKEAG